eukprot:TRINITY_DN23807_c0_g5_i1.p2 TRINITY_DN23807_c0_g5~~TRINITY_DN23807_c0_g5_i1.p2  ORF type:complete len:168 (+),score=0.65 TRINITY_DN23807_c0_g5_i1:235-738(+)
MLPQKGHAASAAASPASSPLSCPAPERCGRRRGPRWGGRGHALPGPAAFPGVPILCARRPAPYDGQRRRRTLQAGRRGRSPQLQRDLLVATSCAPRIAAAASSLPPSRQVPPKGGSRRAEGCESAARCSLLRPAHSSTVVAARPRALASHDCRRSGHSDAAGGLPQL